jgi:hypothetical protein
MVCLRVADGRCVGTLRLRAIGDARCRRRLHRQDRRGRGFTIGQVAWRLGIKPDEYRALEAGEPIHDFETGDRICKLSGWPQTFVGRWNPSL